MTRKEHWLFSYGVVNGLIVKWFYDFLKTQIKSMRISL